MQIIKRASFEVRFFIGKTYTPQLWRTTLDGMNAIKLYDLIAGHTLRSN